MNKWSTSDWLTDAKRAIAKVTCKAPDTTGAAFFIGGNHVLTALHVIADVDSNPLRFASSISLQFVDGTSNLLPATAARVVPEMWDLSQDWAVLECDEPPTTNPLAPGPLPERGHGWHSFGFPDTKPDGMTIGGAVSDPNARYESARAIQLSCKEAEAGQGMLLHGLSGAPCLIEGKACGILRATPLEVVIDGRREKRFQTAGGTVYACHAHTITDALSGIRGGRLTGPWHSAAKEFDLQQMHVVAITSEHVDSADELRQLIQGAKQNGGEEIWNAFRAYANGRRLLGNRIRHRVRRRQHADYLYTRGNSV